MRLYPLKPLQSSHSFTGAVVVKMSLCRESVGVPKPRPPKKVRTVSSSIGSFRGGRDDRFSLPLKSASTTSRRQRSSLSYLPAQQPTYEALMLKQKLADQRRYVYALNEIMTQYDHEKFQRI